VDRVGAVTVVLVSVGHSQYSSPTHVVAVVVVPVVDVLVVDVLEVVVLEVLVVVEQHSPTSSHAVLLSTSPVGGTFSLLLRAM
jgi:hypothetical protein